MIRIIPHDFGMRSPPLIETEEQLKEKTDMLEALLDMEIAASMLKEGGSDVGDPIDQNYEKLRTRMEPVDPDDVRTPRCWVSLRLYMNLMMLFCSMSGKRSASMSRRRTAPRTHLIGLNW